MKAGEARVWFEVFFEISLTLALAAALWKYNKWIAAFLTLTIFSTFHPHYGPMSYLAWRAVFNGCLWYYLIIRYAKDVDSIYDVLIACCLIHVFMAVIQFAKIECWVKSPFPVGLMGNPIELSALIAFCLPAFFRRKKFWLLPFPAIGLIVSGPFLGMLSALIGIAVFFFLSRPDLRVQILIGFPLLITFAMILHYFLIDEPAVSVRLAAWKLGFNAWREHWILGAGIGHWKVVFIRPMPESNKVWLTAHNEYLQMLFELGIGFAVIAGGYILNIIKRINLKNGMIILPVTALIIIMIESGANFVFHIAPTAMVALTWMAILERTLRNET